MKWWLFTDKHDTRQKLWMVRTDDSATEVQALVATRNRGDVLIWSSDQQQLPHQHALEIAEFAAHCNEDDEGTCFGSYIEVAPIDVPHRRPR